MPALRPRSMRRQRRVAGLSRIRLPILAILMTILMTVAWAPAASAGVAPVAGRDATPQAAPSDVLTIRQFTTTEQAMALTFDCGSDRGYAAQILDVAKAKGVRLTFGMTGLWAQQNPDLVRRMVMEGHQLINHTWDHASFTGASTGGGPLSSAQIAAELNQVDNLVVSQTGKSMKPYFRPPYGDYNGAALSAVAAAGYRYNVLWTVDTLGWQGLSVSAIIQRALNAAAPGAIVLMHVGAASQDGPALAGMIDQLRARGFRFATVADFVENRVSPQSVFFAQTGHWLSHGFLRYWQTFGGLSTFGYPISEEMQESGVTVQYFERARFEWHPGAWPERYDVLLGLLGNEVTASRRAAGEVPFRPIQAASDASCTYFGATGHRLCHGFRDYWQGHGGLAILGMPISEEFRENGVTVQYFERQRLEWHPENQSPYDILGGLLGNQVYTARY